MSKMELVAKDAPAAVGPYSQGIAAGRLVFTSGQLPVQNGELIEQDIGRAARACLDNVAAVLEAGHATLADVVKVTVYLVDMKDFGAVNAVYEAFFPTPYPARTCVEVSRLPVGARVEIEALAYIQ